MRTSLQTHKERRTGRVISRQADFITEVSSRRQKSVRKKMQRLIPSLETLALLAGPSPILQQRLKTNQLKTAPLASAAAPSASVAELTASVAAPLASVADPSASGADPTLSPLEKRHVRTTGVRMACQRVSETVHADRGECELGPGKVEMGGEQECQMHTSMST